MTLDGYPARVGDEVFDVIDERYIKIVESSPAGIVCRAGQRTRRYSDAGKRSDGSRTLYWHDPRVAIPPKNAIHWSRLKTTVLEISTRFLLLEDIAGAE